MIPKVCNQLLMNMTEITLKKKLAWQCRRGMLELDVILIPYLEQHFDSLNAETQVLFSELLKEADPDLYTWLMGYGECKKQSFVDLIKLIRNKMGINSENSGSLPD